MHSIAYIPHFHHRVHHPNQGQNQAATAGGTCNFSQMEKATMYQSQETDLTLVTKEGDYVTISADSEFRLDFSTYDRTGRMKGATSQLHSETLSLDSSQEFSISVKGDLNEQEMKDIHNVLQSLDNIMTDLQSGQLDQGMTEAGKLGNLGNLGSLSSIEATLQVGQGISMESARVSETTSVPNKSTNGSEAIEKPVDPKALDVAQSKMMDTLREKDLSPDTMAKIIEKFFLKLSHFLSKNGTQDSAGDGPFDQLKNNLLKEISTKH
jgi:hypothetical protein